MATRCNIQIVDHRTNNELWIYHHYDGYFSGVGEELKTFLNTGNSRLSPDKMLDALIYHYGEEYEQCENEHFDISFKYIIDIYEDKTVLAFIEKDDGFDIKMAEFEYIENTDKDFWKVSNLKKTYARLEYLDKISLSDSGIINNIPDDAYVNEYVLRDKIVAYVKSKLNIDLTIELV